jgi:adenylate cyclase
MQDLAIDELARRTETTPEHLRELQAIGVLSPTEEGRYGLGDVHRVRIADAFLASGISVDALRRAGEAGAISFRYYDLLHAPPGEPSARTYGELRASLGEEQAALLTQLIGASGLAEPEPGSRLESDEERLLLDLLEIAAATGQPDLALRVVRLFGDSLRRASEAVMTVYQEAVDRVIEPAAGLPNQEIFETYLVPWARFGRLGSRMSAWLSQRHLSNAIDAYSVDSTERYLALAGIVSPRTEAPPAVAFVDLTGFTQLAEERGDERLARVAVGFGRLAEVHARRAGGRLVKLLGDGALLQFPDATAAVGATRELMAGLSDADLPPGHAGVHAGPIIVRDGDIFGRTVNLASRIADVAEAGQLLVSRDVADGLPADRFRVASIGEAQLQGIGQPVELFSAEASGP